MFYGLPNSFSHRTTKSADQTRNCILTCAKVTSFFLLSLLAELQRSDRSSGFRGSCGMRLERGFKDLQKDVRNAISTFYMATKTSRPSYFSFCLHSQKWQIPVNTASYWDWCKDHQKRTQLSEGNHHTCHESFSHMWLRRPTAMTWCRLNMFFRSVIGKGRKKPSLQNGGRSYLAAAHALDVIDQDKEQEGVMKTASANSNLCICEDHSGLSCIADGPCLQKHSDTPNFGPSLRHQRRGLDTKHKMLYWAGQ